MIKIESIQETENQKNRSNELLYDKLFEPFKNININNIDIYDFQDEFSKGNFDEYILGLSKQFNNLLQKFNFITEISKKSFLKIFLLRKIDKIKNEKLYIKNEQLKKEIDKKNISFEEDILKYEEFENEKKKEIQKKDERIDKLQNKCITKNNIIKKNKIYFLILLFLVINLQYFINIYGIISVLSFKIILLQYIILMFFNIILGFLNYIFNNFYFLSLVLFVILVAFQFIHFITYKII